MNGEGKQRGRKRGLERAGCIWERVIEREFLDL